MAPEPATERPAPTRLPDDGPQRADRRDALPGGSDRREATVAVMAQEEEEEEEEEEVVVVAVAVVANPSRHRAPIGSHTPAVQESAALPPPDA